MRKKVILCVVILLLFAACLLAARLEAGDHDRVHQHLEASEVVECTHEASVFCTHLPLISLDTGGRQIPGEARDGSVITADLCVFDSPGANNHPTDEPAVHESANIRYRGNSSLHFDKKNFLIKLVDEKGEEKKTALLGMAAGDEWVLHGPFLDKTLMRNYMWYNIGGEIMDWAPNVRFCELLVDGEYRGVYVLTESIDRGETSRIRISKYNEGDPFTSYIVRLDRGVDGDGQSMYKVLDNFSHYARKTPGLLDIKYPGSKYLTEELNRYITEDISKFEKALYSYDYDDKKLGYKAYIDLDSFVDYFIINEFTQNYDAGRFSTYLYKDVRGKLHLAIWDFNNCCDNYQEQPLAREGFSFPNVVWYYMLTKDDDFTDAVIRRYRELRQTWLNEDYLCRYIDDVAAYLGDAKDRNFAVWGYTFAADSGLLTPEERNIGSYDEAILQMKQFIIDRGRWLDDNIDVLAQYSHESKVIKFNH